MNQNKFKQLKSKIIKAVPEILDLKFGCKFQIKNESYKEEKKGGLFDYLIANNQEWKRGNKRYLDYTVFGGIQNGWQGQMRTKDLEDIEIIGRDITLEDVFAAIHQIGRTNAYCGECKFYIEEGIILEKWQLNKSLENQSDEIKEFLYNLLYNLLIE